MEDPDNLKKIISWYSKTSSDAPCPGEETLNDYLQDRLGAEEREAVEGHLAGCETCIQTIIATAALKDDTHVPASSDVPDHVLQKVLAAIPSGRSPSAGRIWRMAQKKVIRAYKELKSFAAVKKPEFAYVRGRKKIISKNLVVLEKVFKDIKLDIEIEKTGIRAADIKVMATYPLTGQQFRNVRITICDNAREIASFVAARGEALFENMMFGDYRLTAWYTKNKLGEVRLTIKE